MARVSTTPGNTTVKVFDVGIAGPAGPAGPQGNQGNQGSIGADSNVVGPQGNQGIGGPQGSDGPIGFQGPQGSIGPIGSSSSLPAAYSGSLIVVSPSGSQFLIVVDESGNLSTLSYPTGSGGGGTGVLTGSLNFYNLSSNFENTYLKINNIDRYYDVPAGGYPSTSGNLQIDPGVSASRIDNNITGSSANMAFGSSGGGTYYGWIYVNGTLDSSGTYHYINGGTVNATPDDIIDVYWTDNNVAPI